MPYELFLALRYLRARRGRRVARWTALAAVVGIACGVAALIVALALANGFRDELRDKILRGTAHVTLAREGGGAIAHARAVAERVRAVEGVLDAAPTTYEGALLGGPRGATYTLLRGLDARSTRARADVQSTLTKGSLDALFQTPNATRDETRTNSPVETRTSSPVETQTGKPTPVVVGEELAARTGLNEVGDEGWVLVGVVAQGSRGFEPRARRVRVVGLFRSGLYEYDATWTYLSLEDVTPVVGAPPATTVVSIEARDIYASDEVARRVRASLGAGWPTVDWRDANPPP